MQFTKTNPSLTNNFDCRNLARIWSQLSHTGRFTFRFIFISVDECSNLTIIQDKLRKNDVENKTFLARITLSLCTYTLLSAYYKLNVVSFWQLNTRGWFTFCIPLICRLYLVIVVV